jgi:hypothetical protein
MGINYKGSQGQTEKAVALLEEEEDALLYRHLYFIYVLLLL